MNTKELTKMPLLNDRTLAERAGKGMASTLKSMRAETPAFYAVWDGLELQFPFHRDELLKAFREGLQ